MWGGRQAALSVSDFLSASGYPSPPALISPCLLSEWWKHERKEPGAAVAAASRLRRSPTHL